MLVGSTRWLSEEKASVCGPALGVLPVSSFRPLWVGSSPIFSPLIGNGSGHLHLLRPGDWFLPVCLSALAAATLQPLPFLLQEILLVPIRPVTEQQLVWRRRESSKGQQYTTGPVSPASDMADTLESDTFNPL